MYLRGQLRLSIKHDRITDIGFFLELQDDKDSY
jgi:hypothetical protein